MADPVVVPAPSPTAPVVVPAASAPAPAAAAVVAPTTPLEVKPAVAAVDAAKPGEPAKPAEAPKPAVAAPVIPEKYDFATVKLPEGVVLNNDLVEAVSPLFKKFGLTQEAASELVQVHAEALAKAEAAAETTRETAFKEWMKTTVTNYQAAIRKEWGAQADANLAIAQRGMATVVSPDMKALLDDTGLGNHPEFLKAFLQVGKMVSEDTPPTPGVPAGSVKNAAQTLYGATTPAQNH